MLDRKGWSVNLKRVHRLWIELGLIRIPEKGCTLWRFPR
jgi:hypothetical protein